MPRKLIVAVVGDVSQFVKSLATGARATEGFNAELKELNVETKVVARAQVDAAVKTTQALREEAAAYTAIAAAAERGSAEQVAATRLAERSQTRLAAAMGTTGTAATHGARGARGLNREVDHAARGALSGSRAFEGFGRSLAFASGGFLAFEGITTFIRDSVDATREAAVAQRSLAAQMRASGESFDANRDRIERVAISYGKFGFQNDEVIQSLTVLERGTGSLNQAIRVQGLTADIARAKNLDLSKAATVVAKVFGGQETALRRAVPGLERNAHGWDLIRAAQLKVAGQAAANTTASERFAATLHDTEEIVGTALLPTLNTYLNSLSLWLQRSNQTGQTQRAVAATTKLVGDAIAATKAVLAPGIEAFRLLGTIVGGTREELKLLFGVFVAFKTLRLVESLAGITTGIRTVGTAAETSEGKVTLLRTSLGRLQTLGLITIGVELAIHAHALDDATKKFLDKIGLGFLGDVATFDLRDLAHDIGIGGADNTQKLRADVESTTHDVDNIFSQFADNFVAAAKAAEKKIAAEASRPGITTAQRNTWFDSMIGRYLGDVQDITSPRGRIGELVRLRGLVQQQLAKVKDVTRRINLGEQIKQINREIRGEQAQIAADAKQAAADAKQKRDDAITAMLDALAFGVDRAALTRTLKDDLAAWKAYQAGVEQQIKIQGRTQELLQRQLDAELGIRTVTAQIAANRKAAAKARREAETAREFRALGLTSAGQERVAGLNTLRALYRQVGKAISDGLIDVNKNTRARLALIGKALKESRLAPEVRRWIDDYLSEIKGGTKQADAEWTKFHTVNANAFIKLAGLGFLNPSQRRRIQTLFAMAGPGFTLPGASSIAFRAGATTTAIPATVAGGVTIHGDVHVHGVQDPAAFEDELIKRAKARPDRRRGAR